MRARNVAIAATTLALLVGGVVPAARATNPTSLKPAGLAAGDWRTYGGSADHTFANTTGLNATNVHTLAPKWFFKTGDAVTANPVVVGNRVYVGSWDGNFYAIDKTTGTQAWKFAITPQPAIVPREDANGRQFEPTNPESYLTSDGGLITSSAWYEPASPQTHGRNLVIFGGGYTLYALDADTGQKVWSNDYTGLPEKPADPMHDEARIFSSPVVVGTKVIFGVSSDGQSGHRGYVAAANLENGSQVWRFETDIDPVDGHVLNDGCGGVWSSGTVVPSHDIVVFDVADCDFANKPPFNESVFALHPSDGTLAWNHRPTRPDNGCDWDFGATPNHGTLPDGTEFLGVGGKDGTYYSLDPATGHERWATNVLFGGLAGGFLGTPSFDGHRVYGATALGDLGRFEGFGTLGCQPGNPRDGL
ncbi:MAG: Pyrrolo-quinoline quinone repeat-containing protein, partial [Acidimicrobiales bacterium]|nr:Pyrrolo-quinoline quinone repeat-containing protein [Acidimicrobiales bacterium]